MAIGADRRRQSHKGPFKNHCRLVPSSETRSGWKEVACDTEGREKGDVYTEVMAPVAR